MALYILDTSIVTLLEHGHQPTTANHKAHATDMVIVTSSTVEEAIGGWIAFLRRARTNAQRASGSESLANSAEFLSQFPVQPMTVAMYDRFDSLVKQKLNIGSMDLKIAASALELGATVVTHNVRDFRRVPGLLWEDWTQ